MLGGPPPRSNLPNGGSMADEVILYILCIKIHIEIIKSSIWRELFLFMYSFVSIYIDVYGIRNGRSMDEEVIICIYI